MSDNPKNDVLVARISAAHGIRGEVRAQVFTEEPVKLAALGALHDRAGRRFEIAKVRPAKNQFVLVLKGVADRNAAEALKGTELFIDRAGLPDEGLDDDEVYFTDLEGLAVVDTAGAARGTVVAVHDFGAGIVLEIDPGDRSTVMIPFSEAAVPDIDIEGGRLTVEPVAAGLEGAGDAEEDAPR